MKRKNRVIRFSDAEFQVVTAAAESIGVERSKFIRNTSVLMARFITEQEPKVIFKFREGMTGTHSAGRVVKCWRLFDNGRLERTNSKSKYVQPFAHERIPEELLEYAENNGLMIKGLRTDKQGVRR